jgi:uncharacterized protein involved in exopolysaccharide biosynthesis
MSVTPSIEIIPSFQGMPDNSGQSFGEPETPKPPKNQRLLLFIAIFSLCLAASLAYVWLREPIYQSTASLLTVAPEEAGIGGGNVTVHPIKTQDDGLVPSIPLAAIERSENPANPEHVTLQRQILLGVPVFEETLHRLYEHKENAGAPRLNLSDLRGLLSVDMVKGTNMVEMKAQGPAPQILAPLVNTWIDAYQALREQTMRDAKSNNYAALEEESKQLEKKIAENRKKLAAFRSTHDILSRTDSDNTPMMKLKGLNEAYNKATDEQVKAKAKLDAIRAAIARGEPVMSPEDGPGLAALEKRVQELRETLKEVKRRFTPTYMAMNPQMRQIPEKLAQAEAAVKQKLEYGSRALLSQTEQNYVAALQSAQELRQKIAEMKMESSEFTNRFAEQQAMEDDLKETGGNAQGNPGQTGSYRI